MPCISVISHCCVSRNAPESNYPASPSCSLPPPPTPLARCFVDAQYSSGIIAFYWCVSRSIPELLHHNTFISPGGPASWDLIFAGSAQVFFVLLFLWCCSGVAMVFLLM
jgi:hypothetical protein